jgi:hypothetical protein
MKDEIIVKSIVSAREAPGLKTIQHKAVAGISEAELIKRHTIGEYDKQEDDETEKA